MNKIFFIGYFLIIAISYGCDSSKDYVKRNECAVIRIADPVENLTIEDLVGDYDLIKLETSDKSLLSGIHQIHIMNHKLYVTDRKMQGVYIFTEKGKYLSKIENVGQGPEEYIRIGSFETDPFRNRLLLADNFSKRLFVYDELGSLQKVVSLDFSPLRIVSDQTKAMIHLNSIFESGYSNKDMEIHILDTLGKVIETLLPRQLSKRVDIGSIFTPSYTEDGKLLYLPILGGTIYRIDDSMVVPLYVMQSDSKYKVLSDVERKKMEYITGRSNTLEKEEKKGTLISWGDFLSSDSLVCLKFGYDVPIFVFYSKNLNRSLSIEPDLLKGNEGLRKLFLGNLYTLHTNRFYTQMDYQGISRLLPLLPRGKFKSTLEQFTEEDNPCVISYSLKIDSCLSVFAK